MIDVRIQQGDFNMAEEWEEVLARMDGQGGAIASFAGVVRSSGDEITGLYLEHYPGMTEKSVYSIAQHAENRWNLLEIVVVHRVGELRIGDQVVLVIVGSEHRAEAFAACEFLMDYLKTEAVLWKKERRRTRDSWVQSTPDDRRRARSWHIEANGTVKSPEKA